MTGAALTAHGTAPPGLSDWAVALLPPVVAGALYAAGVVVLARRGTVWPGGRVLAAAAGLGCVAAALSPPVAAGTEVFPGHVVQHLLLTMLAPLLLACSAPVTLALRTLPRRPRAGLLRVLQSRAARIVTAPVAVVVLELGSLAVLYLTPLYAAVHAAPGLHLLVHGHMFLTGCLVSWLLAGVDPMPGRPGTPVRLGVLVVLAAGHTVLAKLLYADPPAALGGAADVRRGAELLAYGGDVVEVLLAVAVMTEWWRRTGRRLRAEQRRALPAV
ncbi:cytochrome c oxidase assembly protein [Modestobacter sp. URMC 112]